MAQASLTASYVFNGQGNWSIDAVGSNNDPVGNVRAFVPVGSTVVKAFLYSSTYTPNINPDVTLAGTNYAGAAWTSLGIDNGFLQAWRTDVTAQMQAAIGGGSASNFLFDVHENVNNSGTDGEGLVVVYSNAAESTRTIALLDGFSASGGDSTTLNFGSGLTGVGSAGFEAQLSLGIGFGYQTNGYGGQYSTVDVNGRRLTSSAGGQDDGQGYNGGLITMGGIGDSTANPDPYASAATNGPRTDDELYDLGQGNVANAAPFVANGDTSALIQTQNPSGDDNIFFAGINITANASVTTHPTVPDSGSTVAFLGLGLMGLAAARRFLGKAKV